MQQIYLSTRAAARLAGCEPHVLYAHHRRHGHYHGVEPRKGIKGRLSWPADALRGCLLPPPDQQPEGMSALLDLVAVVAPEIEPAVAYRIANELLGSEATCGWVPSPGQLSDERLTLVAGIVGMASQAFAQRVEQAQAQRGCEVAAQVVEWLCAVNNRAFRYLLPGKPDSEVGQ